MSNLMLVTLIHFFLIGLYAVVAVGFYFLAEKRRKEERLERLAPE